MVLLLRFDCCISACAVLIDTYLQIASCLRDIDELLKDIDKPDRLRYCKSDFEIAIGQLRERDMVIPDTLTEMIISMTLRYFNEVLIIYQH